MNKVLSILFLSFFVLSVKGQSPCSIKDSFIYTDVVLYTDSVVNVGAMIDTGCSLCLIDSTFANSLGLNMKNKQMVYEKKDGLLTCIVDSLEFCGKMYCHVPCLVANLKGIFQKYAPNFLIGGDILRDRPLKFNLVSMMIEPFSGKHEKGSVIMKWKDYKSNPNIPALFIMFDVKINDIKYDFAFDTGSRGNKLPYNIQLKPSDIIQKETADINNALTIKQQRIYKDVNIQIANNTFNLDFFEGKKKWGLLSLDFIKDHSFILNYRDRTLEVLPY